MTEVLERTFDPSIYDLPVPELDGHKAARLDIRFSGSGELDRTSSDDLDLLKAARLGNPVRLIVIGEIKTKTFRLDKKPGVVDELVFSCTVKVLAVEAGEEA